MQVYEFDVAIDYLALGTNFDIFCENVTKFVIKNDRIEEFCYDFDPIKKFDYIWKKFGVDKQGVFQLLKSIAVQCSKIPQKRVIAARITRDFLHNPYDAINYLLVSKLESLEGVKINLKEFNMGMEML